MTHSEFVNSLREKRISVHVNESLALRVLSGNVMPARYKAAHNCWSLVWLLMFPAALVLGVWYHWWAGILCLLATGIVKSAVKKSACEFVLEYALENEGFYRAMLKAGVFRLESAGSEAAVAA